MKTLRLAALAWLANAAFLAGVDVPQMVSDELSIGYLPIEWVNAAVKATLSPQSKAVMSSPTGPLRVTDFPERIDLARQKLLAFQHAPALVSVELSFTTYTKRTVQRLPAEQPVVDRGIPVPDRYDPPRIIAGPGGFAVIPAQPRRFTTRNVGPGTTVNPNPTGYVTSEPEVRLSETETVSKLERRFSVSTVLGKPVSASVLRQAADVPALRDIAVRGGAIAENEPAWTAAGTDLLITPELSGATVVIHVVPRVVLLAVASQPSRPVPLNAHAAGVLVARGAPPSTGLLPKTDPDFYRAFLGITPADNDTIIALTVKAQVQYLGSPPQ